MPTNSLGNGTFLVDQEARFVTPNGIRALAGTPKEIAARFRECERAGLTVVTPTLQRSTQQRSSPSSRKRFPRCSLLAPWRNNHPVMGCP